jgi:hypothetical protein
MAMAFHGADYPGAAQQQKFRQEDMASGATDATAYRKLKVQQLGHVRATEVGRTKIRSSALITVERHTKLH